MVKRVNAYAFPASSIDTFFVAFTSLSTSLPAPLPRDPARVLLDSRRRLGAFACNYEVFYRAFDTGASLVLGEMKPKAYRWVLFASIWIQTPLLFLHRISHAHGTFQPGR